MFEEDEEELELLRQYESKNTFGQEHESASDEQLDSETEDKIMSLIHYSSGLKKKKAVKRPLSPSSESSDSSDQQASSSDEEKESEEDNDSDESSEEDEESDSESTAADEPSVTRYISLDADNPSYIDEESEDEEESELNSKLQGLIQDQIHNRERNNRKKTRLGNTSVCFGCSLPGHDRKDCPICADCGELKHEHRCNPLMYCKNCKRRGHKSSECRYPRELSACSRCGSHEHITKQCPTIVHTYVLGNSPAPISEAIPRYCYSCGSQDHYGDECPMLPDYMRQVHTAFTIENTRPLQAFIGQRHHNRRGNPYNDNSQRSRRGRHDELDEFFSRRHHGNGNARRQDEAYHHSHHHNHRQQAAPRNQWGEPGRQRGRHGQGERTGSNNWNAIPQPTRSGTVNVNNAARQQREQRAMDFPRGNNGSLPRPSASGVIVPEASRQRAPRYRGGYSRR